MDTPSSNRSGLGRALAGVAGTSVVLVVLGTAVSVMVSPSLGPDGRGQYATVVAIAAITIALANLSIGQVQIYMVALGRSVAALVSNALFFGAALGVVAAAVTTP